MAAYHLTLYYRERITENGTIVVVVVVVFERFTSAYVVVGVVSYMVKCR